MLVQQLPDQQAGHHDEDGGGHESVVE